MTWVSDYLSSLLTAGGYLALVCSHIVDSSQNDLVSWILALMFLIPGIGCTITGLTSQGGNRNLLLNYFQLFLSAVWLAFGFSYLSVAVDLIPNFQNATVPLLFPGTVVTSFDCFLFIGLGLLDSNLLVALLGLIFCIGFILESLQFYISDIYVPSPSTAYILGAVIVFYDAIRNVVGHFNIGKNLPQFSTPNGTNKSKDQDLHFLIGCAYSLYILALSPILFQYDETYDFYQSFSWPLAAGLLQILIGLKMLRSSQLWHGIQFITIGSFWATHGLGILLKASYNLPMTSSNTAAAAVFFIVFFITTLMFLFKAIGIVDLIFQLSLSLVPLLLAISGPVSTGFVTVTWLSLVISVVAVFCHTYLGATQATPPKDVLGKTFARRLSNVFLRRGTLEASPGDKKTLGSSKYLDISFFGFLINCLAAVPFLVDENGAERIANVLPFNIVLGFCGLFAAASISWSRGQTFESCLFYVQSSFWLIVGMVHVFGTSLEQIHPTIFIAYGVFLATFLLFGSVSIVMPKYWTVYMFLSMFVVVAFLLHNFKLLKTFAIDVSILTVFSVYCAFCFILNVMQKDGKTIKFIMNPFLEGSWSKDSEECVMADSRKASGAQAISELMNEGKICALPTDTVYVLTAACRHPQAVQRAYNTKKQAGDRPMSLWISHMNQIAGVEEEFGPLLWAFMKQVWPSSISLVIKKGRWMDQLGLGESHQYIGKPDSIAVRLPDNAATTHIIDLVGPIAVTSANPTGEADTTHHLQVLPKLGAINCDGILCDGPSPENAASTVVDCTKIESGLRFFRVGIMPEKTVLDIYNNLKNQTPTTSTKNKDSDQESGISSEANGTSADEKNGYDNPFFTQHEHLKPNSGYVTVVEVNKGEN